MGTFVLLFYILSGFSMCCGYYEKIKENKINLNSFYNRRYERILPFFALLVVIDLAVGFIFDGGISAGSFAEAFADLTLMFGLYTTSGMSVIGVGWTLGIIFGFYILFPFFVYLIWNKKRAWFSLIITAIIYILCAEYFQSGTSLTFRWMCYFVLGGLVYLYRDYISNILEGRVWLGLTLSLVGFVLVFVIPSSIIGEAESFVSLFKNMFGFFLMLSGALCEDFKLWSNPFSKFVSKVSLQIYISHMLIFRMVEKTGLTTIAGESVVSYIIASVVTIIGVLIFASAYQYIEKIIKKRVVKA